MAVAGVEVSAQEGQEPWAPTQGMVRFSLGSYGTDSETTRRIGLGWVRSPHNVLAVTGQFWDRYRHLSVESRWYSQERRQVWPFLLLSGTWQGHGDVEGVGPGVAVGADYYLTQPIGLTAALGWRSLFRWWRVPGYSQDPADLHWFTIRMEVAVYLGG
jgi:hypothetical protein